MAYQWLRGYNLTSAWGNIVRDNASCCSTSSGGPRVSHKCFPWAHGVVHSVEVTIHAVISRVLVIRLNKAVTSGKRAKVGSLLRWIALNSCPFIITSSWGLSEDKHWVPPPSLGIISYMFVGILVKVTILTVMTIGISLYCSLLCLWFLFSNLLPMITTSILLLTVLFGTQIFPLIFFSHSIYTISMKILFIK